MTHASSSLTFTISPLATFRKSDDRSQGLDACLARHAHACTRVTAVRTVRKTGGRRCRREHKSGNGRAKRGAKRKETAAAATAAAAAAAAASAASGDEAEGGEGGARGSEQKGAPFVGGYRENEARHRVPHGPFSRHGARQRPQQSGPPSAGARCPGPCSRQRQRQARASHATRTRPCRPSREHKPRFFHPRRYLPLPPPLLAAVTAALSATSLLLVFPSFFSASPRPLPRRAPALAVTSRFFPPFFIMIRSRLFNTLPSSSRRLVRT